MQTIQTNINNKTSETHDQPLIQPGEGGEILEPQDLDVICGRGGKINAHEGNIRFRDIVSKFKKQYLEIKQKSEKCKFCMFVVREIRKSEPAVRFLNKNSKTKKWLEIGDEKAMKKVGQALRENGNVIRQNEEKEKQQLEMARRLAQQQMMCPLPPPHGYPHPYPNASYSQMPMPPYTQGGPFPSTIPATPVTYGSSALPHPNTNPNPTYSFPHPPPQQRPQENAKRSSSCKIFGSAAEGDKNSKRTKSFSQLNGTNRNSFGFQNANTEDEPDKLGLRTKWRNQAMQVSSAKRKKHELLSVRLMKNEQSSSSVSSEEDDDDSSDELDGITPLNFKDSGISEISVNNLSIPKNLIDTLSNSISSKLTYNPKSNSSFKMISIRSGLSSESISLDLNSLPAESLVSLGDDSIKKILANDATLCNSKKSNLNWTGNNSYSDQISHLSKGSFAYNCASIKSLSSEMSLVEL